MTDFNQILSESFTSSPQFRDSPTESEAIFRIRVTTCHPRADGVISCPRQSHRGPPPEAVTLQSRVGPHHSPLTTHHSQVASRESPLTSRNSASASAARQGSAVAGAAPHGTCDRQGFDGSEAGKVGVASIDQLFAEADPRNSSSRRGSQPKEQHAGKAGGTRRQREPKRDCGSSTTGRDASPLPRGLTSTAALTS